MEENFRNVLIILSAVVITAIFIHGLWVIRKQKNPYKLKTSKDKSAPITRDFDGKGFDQDGVGQIKVKDSGQRYQTNLEDELVEEHVFSTSAQIPNDFSKNQTLIKDDVSTDISQQTTKIKTEKDDSRAEQTLDSSLENDWFKEDHTPQFTKDELGDELTPTKPTNTNEKDITVAKERAYIEPLYKQPVTQHKPDHTPSKKVDNTLTETSLKREKIENDFDNQKKAQQTQPEVHNTQLEPQVIILSVVMPANQQMLGAALLPSLLTLGLKYGEMNIFHRHEDSAGNGRVTFSLANIMNPGSFDLDTMETFATRGVSLFMTLPNASDPLAVFDKMLNAAKQLAQEFNAQILDNKRNVMTKQTEQHYLSKIREFDRKSRIT